MKTPVICAEHYYPKWSSRGMRAVNCRNKAKKYIIIDGLPHPICGVHLARELRNFPSRKVVDLE